MIKFRFNITKEKSILTDKFFEVLKFKGVVTILSWGGEDEPNVVNTWNSYLLVKDETIICQ